MTCARMLDVPFVYAKEYLSGESVGTTMSTLNHNIVSKMPNPVLPLAEQKRIIVNTNKLLPLYEEMKRRKNKLKE